MSKTATARGALQLALDSALPLSPKEAVLSKLADDVRERKKLLDDIRKHAERPRDPKKRPVADYLKELRGRKGQLTRDLRLQRRSDASPAAIERTEEKIRKIDEELERWRVKPPYWVDEESILFMLNGLTWEAGRGKDRDHLSKYARERGREAAAELVSIKAAKPEHARRLVAGRLNREAGVKFTGRSLRPAAKKRATK